MTDSTPISVGGGVKTPSVALTIVDEFAKFKECGFIPKTTTWPRPHPFQRKFFYPWDGTCRSWSTCQI